jgi:hypothetical protein
MAIVGMMPAATSTVLASRPGPSASLEGMRMGDGPRAVIGSSPPLGCGSKNIASLS